MKQAFDLPLQPQRLLGWLEELATLGATPEGGVRRLAATDADKQGRDRLVAWMRALSLHVQVDRIGNLFGTLRGEQDAPALMIGSHIDSVANGGKLDGTYGVLAGLEIVASFVDAGIRPQRPITVAAFTNEEGARFQPDMLGSLVSVGGMDLETARNTRDAEGLTLGDELDRIGYSGTLECGAMTPACFLELHIEQGPVLEAEGLTLGAVEGVQGIHWTEVIFKGQANHAGTTPMHLRMDAGLAAARLNVEARAIAKRHAPGQVATVGTTVLRPGVVNVVPAQASMTVDLRNADRDELVAAQSELEAAVATIARDEGLTYEMRELVRFDPVVFDESLIAMVEDAARAIDRSVKRMVSGAGHDAQMFARVCPTAMIFVPSIAGVSHNPREATTPEDLEAGLLALAHVATRLSSV